MSISDAWIKGIAISGVLIYAVIFIIGLKTHKLLRYISLLNLLSGLIFVLYWILKQLRITQHSFELRELIFLAFELVVVFLSLYVIQSVVIPQWAKYLSYTFFSLQFLILVLFLLIMFFFKMNKLV